MNLLKSFNVGIRKICARSPAPWAAWIHQILAAGGGSGYTTMVVMFVVCVLCVAVLSGGTSDSSYVKEYWNITLR